MRQSGILLHISSLPGPGGVGSLGKEAFAFADFLKAAGMTIWQVLPMGPTGYGESPYQSSSVYAGNPVFISCARLREEGLLDYKDSEEYTPENKTRVDFDAVRANKDMLLHRAFDQSNVKLTAEIDAFVAANPWVEDFALFTAVKQSFGGVQWTQWPDLGIRFHKKQSVVHYRLKLDREVRFQIFCQYLFKRQWTAFKKYCNGLGISLFGDMPIYVAEDSADTWTNPQVFQLDSNRIPKRVAGVPPDLFSADGQLWGNPLYRWNYLWFTGYKWWVARMRHMAEMYDIVRIDHFIGFANYYSIPHGAPNARGGKWIIGPGKALFNKLSKAVPGINIIAEDLGVINDRVRALLKYVGYPGMKVLSFGFDGGPDNPHNLSNWTKNAVGYTGTHDNDTILGWFASQEEKTRQTAMTVLGFSKAEEAPEAFMRAVLASPADKAVILMQDVLGLDGSARMNLPGTVGGNWVWRMKPEAANDKLAAHLRKLNEKYDRR